MPKTPLNFDGLEWMEWSSPHMEGTPSIQRRLLLIPYRLLQMTPDMTMITDSSISQRSDIFKILALGADAVMIGRLPLYGLAVMGTTGVEHILHMLLEE